MLSPQHLLYKNVFPSPTIEGANSLVVLAADFNDIQFTLQSALYAQISDLVGDFNVGDILFGQTSSATGEILSYDGSNIVLGNVVGDFIDSEQVQDQSTFAIGTIFSPHGPSFTVKLFKSNNGMSTPPNPALPASPENQYSQIMYTDEQGGVNYDTAHPFNSAYDANTNPLPYDQKVFKAYTQGAVWIFLRISDYTNGAVAQCDIDLFNQN